MADGSLEDLSTLDISKLKVPDLKKELKSRGLSTTGNKNELIERLRSVVKSNEGSGNTVSIDDIEEDLLNDDDDDHIEERDSIINEIDSELEDLPKVSPTAQKRKPDGEKSDSGPPKKVILKRNTTETLAALAETTKNAETPKELRKPIETLESENDNNEKKVIKLSELSAKERLEMRAKKFGVTALSTDAKKLARAERFGTDSATSKQQTDISTIKLGNTTNVDLLKQRALRFGTSVSSVMTDVERKEKLEKRKERFGISTSNGKTPDSLEAAKAARLERFKTTVK